MVSVSVLQCYPGGHLVLSCPGNSVLCDVANYVSWEIDWDISIRLFTDIFYATKSTMDDGWMTDRYVQGNYTIFRQLKELIRNNTDSIENKSCPTSLHLHRVCKPTVCSLESPTPPSKVGKDREFPLEIEFDQASFILGQVQYVLDAMQCNDLLPYLQQAQGQCSRLYWTRFFTIESFFSVRFPSRWAWTRPKSGIPPRTT